MNELLVGLTYDPHESAADKADRYCKFVPSPKGLGKEVYDKYGKRIRTEWFDGSQEQLTFDGVGGYGEFAPWTPLGANWDLSCTVDLSAAADGLYATIATGPNQRITFGGNHDGDHQLVFSYQNKNNARVDVWNSEKIAKSKPVQVNLSGSADRLTLLTDGEGRTGVAVDMRDRLSLTHIGRNVSGMGLDDYMAGAVRDLRLTDHSVFQQRYATKGDGVNLYGEIPEIELNGPFTIETDFIYPDTGNLLVLGNSRPQQFPTVSLERDGRVLIGKGAGQGWHYFNPHTFESGHSYHVKVERDEANRVTVEIDGDTKGGTTIDATGYVNRILRYMDEYKTASLANVRIVNNGVEYFYPLDESQGMTFYDHGPTLSHGTWVNLDEETDRVYWPNNSRFYSMDSVGHDAQTDALGPDGTEIWRWPDAHNVTVGQYGLIAGTHGSSPYGFVEGDIVHVQCWADIQSGDAKFELGDNGDSRVYLKPGYNSFVTTAGGISHCLRFTSDKDGFTGTIKDISVRNGTTAMRLHNVDHEGRCDWRSAGPNLVLNGDARMGTLGWGGSAGIEAEDGVFHLTQESSYCSVGQDMALEKGATYKLSAEIYKGTCDGYVQIRSYPPSGPSEIIIDIRGADGHWHHSEGTFTVPADSTRCSVALHGASSVGEAWYKNISITKMV